MNCSTCYIQDVSRQEQLLTAATNYVLTHGLIGLSLRPLAAAIGTSDRMLIYHFETRDALVTAIIGQVNDRSVEALGTLDKASSVRAGVLLLWAAYQREPMRSCEQVYVQATASGLLGDEPYRCGVRRANDRWRAGLSAYLSDCGAPPERLARITSLVDSALLGFYVDLATDTPEELLGGVKDLADAAHALAHPPLSLRSPRPRD